MQTTMALAIYNSAIYPNCWQRVQPALSGAGAGGNVISDCGLTIPTFSLRIADRTVFVAGGISDRVNRNASQSRVQVGFRH